MGDPRLLRALARRSSASPSPELDALLADMRDTMAAQNGAGLAAPQIGVPLRVVIFGVERNPRYPDAEPVPYTELVNPVLTPLTDEMEEGWEGCLSVPGSARRRAALHAAALRGLRSARARRSRARSTASTRASCSTSATTWTASSIRCAMRDFARFGFTDVLFPDVVDEESTATGYETRRRRRAESFARLRVSIRPQLLVQRRLQPQQRLLVVQARAVDQEHVLRALAQRVDLRARDVDVGLREHVGDAREQARAGRRRRPRGCSACPCRRGRSAPPA